MNRACSHSLVKVLVFGDPLVVYKWAHHPQYNLSITSIFFASEHSAFYPCIRPQQVPGQQWLAAAAVARDPMSVALAAITFAKLEEKKKVQPCFPPKPWTVLTTNIRQFHNISIPYSSALKPHSRIGRTPDFGGKKKKKTGKNEEKSWTCTCLLFSWRPSSFGLINIWLKFQEYWMASTINLTIESLVKLKATNMWKHVWDCALSTADRRPSYNKYIVLTSKKMFRGTHHNYSFIIKTNLCCFGAILMRLN